MTLHMYTVFFLLIVLTVSIIGTYIWHVAQSISYGLYIAACIWIKWILNKIELNWIECYFLCESAVRKLHIEARSVLYEEWLCK
jgi:hypothetical protein